MLIADRILKEIQLPAGLFAVRGPGVSDPGPQRRRPSPAARASASGWPPRSARSLMGVLYILDEPSIGLHQRDNDKLLATLKHLRDLGNTLIVVEHDEDTMRAADYLVDIGPGAGVHGGQVVAAGTPEEVMANPDSHHGPVSLRKEENPGAGGAPAGQRQGSDGHRRGGEQPPAHRRGIPPGHLHRASPASPAAASPPWSTRCSSSAWARS